jgi:predicted anti-sigma-YlaC factor YlaD
MHSEYTLLMSLALDDEAAAADLARLHAHLATCAECRRIWARWQEMDRRLQAEPLLVAPTGLARQVAARLDERELQRRRMRWLGSGLALGWLALSFLGVLAAAGLFAWLSANLQQVGILASTAAQALTAFNGLLRGVVATADSIGAPVLAAIVGGLACMTCGLGMVWLWLVPHGGRLTKVVVQHE